MARRTPHSRLIAGGLALPALALAAVLFLFAAEATPADPPFDMADRFMGETEFSHIGFSFDAMGIGTIAGRFRPCCLTAFYDPEHPEDASVSFRLRTETLDAGSEQASAQIKAGLLEVERFPEVVFRSNEVRSAGDGFDLVGDLTVKDVTREVSMRIERVSEVVRMPDGREGVNWRGHLVIDRREFGMTGPPPFNAPIGGRPMIGNEIRIDFSITGQGFTPEYLAGRFDQEVAPGLKHPTGSLYAIAVERGADAAIAEFDRLEGEGWPEPMRGAMSAEQLRVAGHGILSDLGWMLMLNGRPAAAITVFHRGLEAPAEESTAWTTRLRLADAYMFARDWASAKGAYEEALEYYGQHLHAEELLRHVERLLQQE